MYEQAKLSYDAHHIYQRVKLPKIAIEVKTFFLTALLDTGASRGIISAKIARALGLMDILRQNKTNLTGVNRQHRINCLGEVTIELVLGTRLMLYNMLVVDDVIAGVII